MVGWVLFRADTLPQAMTFLSLMFGVRQATELRQLLGMHLTNQVACAILLGVLFSMPFRPWLGRLRGKLMAALPRGIRPGILCADLVFEPVLLMGLFILSAVWLAGGTYNPFIYFRF
jgi:alginate O-acetyltransferase complex protein AlgI